MYKLVYICGPLLFLTPVYVLGKDYSKTEKLISKELKIIQAPVEDTPFRKGHEGTFFVCTLICTIVKNIQLSIFCT